MRFVYAALAVLLFWALFYAFGTEIGLTEFDFGRFMLITAIVAAGGLAGGD